MKIRLSTYGILLAILTGIIFINFPDLTFNSMAQAQDVSCAAITEIPAGECQVLASLYQSTAGENWIENRGWFTTSTPCKWFGVICDPTLDEVNHVTRLALTQNNLVGTIPANIADLTYLQELELSYNQLEGSIPNSVGSLDRLIWLTLHDNQLSGEIPATLGNLSALQLLSFSTNQLTGSIPPALGDLSNLSKLHLAENQLSGDLPQTLSNLRMLEVLDLSYNQLTGPILSSLGGLGRLQELLLSENQLEGEIPATLGNLSALRLLAVAVNQLSGALPASLGNLTELQELYLSENLLDGPIPIELGNLAQLEYLELNGNQLSGTIPAPLGDLLLLQKLALSDNQLSGEIPTTLGNLIALRGLHLNSNQFVGTIPIQLGNLSNLMTLYLHNNQLSGPLPTKVGSLNSLTILSVNGNQFSGTIPVELGNLTDLTALGLAGNQFSGAIPASLGNLSNLEQLMLQSNQLTGEVPAPLAALPMLNPVLVSYNGITASDPAVRSLLDESDVDWAKTQTVAPTDLSSNLAANRATGNYDLHLAWQTIDYVDDEGYYEIDYAGAPDGVYQEGGRTIDKKSDTFKLSGLVPSTNYVIRVRTYTPAHGSQQNDIWSDYITLALTTPPPIVLDCELVPTEVGENCFDLDDEDKEVTLAEGEFLTIKLPTTPSAGSFWYVVNDETGVDAVGTPILRPLDRPTFRMPDLPYPVVGQTGTEIYRFDPVAPGTTTVHLEYRDVQGNVSDTYTVYINNEGSFDNAQTPSTQPQDTSLLPTHSPTQPGGRSRSRRASQNLPTSYSLCDHPDGNNYCPPIQNQGSCGSCWAFTTVGAMETLINYKDGVVRDLSEQALLSCNSESAGTDPETGVEKYWSCANGGWYAFDYYMKTKTDPHQTGPGTVWELNFLYTGEDSACKPGLEHHEKLTSWSYINPDDRYSMSYVDDIKQALYEYGPVVTSLCVGPAVNEYRGGIFSTDERSLCTAVDQDTNHAVVIVGWDDAEGVWIMRNSWGTWWGEEGYMRIKYGTSNIGFSAAYALYEGSDAKGPSAPTDLKAESKVIPEGYQLLISWADNSEDETGFQIFSQIDGSWQLKETLPANSTTFTAKEIECNQDYTYRLSAINDEGVSGYSNMVKISAECEDLQPPTNFIASTSGTGIGLTWDNLNVLQDGVLILRWNWALEDWDELVRVDSDTQHFEDRTDLEPGQTYAYILQAFIGDRLSNPTEYQQAVAPVAQVEGPSKARAETVGEGEIWLTWEDNSNNEDGYIIMRYNPDTKQWDQIETLDIDATEHVDVQLDCGDQAIHYQVLAYRGTVQSTVSNQVSSLPCPEVVQEATPVPTETPTATPTIIPTATFTNVPTETPTATNMPTETSTVTPTMMPTAADTEVPTATLVPTDVSTDTPEPTETPMPADTAVPTATLEPSSTPTAVPTASPTVISDDEDILDRSLDDELVYLPIILR